jgi:DNA-binding response OmpR family regulator
VIVEDQPELGRALERVFRSRGYDAKVVESCGRVLGSMELWDCAVLDVDLPDGSGVNLSGEMLRRRQTKCVVFFSAQVDPEVRRRAEAFGPFVSKMADLDELLDTVSWELRRVEGGSRSGTYERSRDTRSKRRAKA